MHIRRHSKLDPTIADRNYQIAPADAEPANILEKIIWQKEQEVEQMRQARPISFLVQQLENAPVVRDFAAALRHSPQKPALIAEVKKASPSKGVIRADFDPVAIAQAYERGGASCLSVLTDTQFFQGSFNNLKLVRGAVNLPLLCKEFIIDPYQIYWARLHGADAVLLIAAVLSDLDLQQLLTVVDKLGMSALVEVHTASELARVLQIKDVAIVGINNRDLETFAVDLAQTQKLMARLDDSTKQQILWVSESGIYTHKDLEFVANCGASAVLVGESLIKQDNIEMAVQRLIN